MLLDNGTLCPHRVDLERGSKADDHESKKDKHSALIKSVCRLIQVEENGSEYDGKDAVGNGRCNDWGIVVA